MGKEREGKQIYEEGGIEVRDSPLDSDAYNLWIGDNSFLLQRGVLEEFVEKTPVERLKRALDNYDPTLPMVLEESKISPEGLVLILARARIKEIQSTATAGILSAYIIGKNNPNLPAIRRYP